MAANEVALSRKNPAGHDKYWPVLIPVLNAKMMVPSGPGSSMVRGLLLRKDIRALLSAALMPLPGRNRTTAVMEPEYSASSTKSMFSSIPRKTTVVLIFARIKASSVRTCVKAIDSSSPGKLSVSAIVVPSVDGESVGDSVGVVVGDIDGEFDGEVVGEEVGAMVGEAVG